MDCKNQNNLRTLHEPNKSKKINKVQRTKNYMEHKNPKIFYELQIQINSESTAHADKSK